jgi:hypothetical protein
MSDQIRTTYHGPTDTRGSRITAVFISGPFKGRRKTMPYDHAAKDPHVLAANRLIHKVNDIEWTYGDQSAEYVGTGNSGNVYKTYPPIMPAWVGERVLS